jgi:hypothetical protein
MKTKLLLMISLCAVCTVSLLAQTPVAEYPLISDTKPTVGKLIASGTNTTFVDDAAFATASYGAGAKVLNFNGGAGGANDTAAYVDLDVSLYAYNALSINIWFNCNSVDTWSRIFTFGAGNNNKLPEVFFTTADGRTASMPAFGVDLTAGASPQSVIDITDTVTVIDVDKWYMLTCCADISFGYFYLNGKLVAKNDISAMATAPKGFTFDNAWLGKSGWPDPYFNGKMHLLQVYDKVLTAEEITATYKAQSPPTAVKPNVNTNNINVYSKDSRIFVNNLKSSKTASVAVYDLTGKLVQLKSNSNISNVEFKQGLYIVKVTGNNINYSSKIVVR